MIRLIAAGAALVLGATAASAQQSNEDRLRDALRRTTQEARGLQDSQVALQAQLADVTRDRDALRLLLDQAKAQSAPPPAPAAPVVDPAELKALRDALARTRSEAAGMQAALAKWQAAYKDAAGVAQAKDAEVRQLGAAAAARQQDLASCAQANTRVIATARDMLRWFQSRGFRTLVLESYEPFLRLKRVELENTVQDYEDKLASGTFRGTAKPPL